MNNLIFREYGFCYMAIPKAANTSIKRALLPLIGYSSDIKAPNIHDRNCFPFDYCNNRQLVEEKKNLFVFSVVRNPWTRIASLYKDKICRTQVHKPLQKYGCEPNMPFADFIDIVSNLEDEGADVHIKSQYSMLFYEKQLVPNLIFKLEELEFYWPRTALILNNLIGDNVIKSQIGNYNAKSNGDFRSLYDPASMKKIEKRYEEEIDFFGYKY